MKENNLKIVKGNLKNDNDIFDLEQTRPENCPNCNAKTTDRACCVKCGKYIDKDGFAPEEEFLWSKAWFAAVNRDYGKAIEINSELIKMFPEKSRYYSDRGRDYFHNGQYKEAIADYNKAIELEPDNDWNYEGRAMVYMENKQYDEAFADYTKMIEMHPEIPNKYRNRAAAYSSAGQYDKAIADFSKGLELTEDFFKNPAIDEYGEKYFESGNSKYYPLPLYYYLNSRAYAYKELGQFEKAIADINNALETCDLAYDRSCLYNSRAEIFEAAGEYQKAINDCKKALELTLHMEAKIPSTNEILERCRNKLMGRVKRNRFNSFRKS
ncbi:MAG: tetratricopeptide repeat protein [Treponema sp.]|jgi:tetratricopeptide (TPR) repeat protein|nr:tetratricopeptide repeat protein [Treponema sp.]